MKVMDMVGWVLALAIFTGILCIPAVVLMFLWNALLVGWLNFPVIDFWAAFGVLWVISILGYALGIKR